MRKLFYGGIFKAGAMMRWLLIIFMLAAPVMAENAAVVALQDFSTLSPSKELKIILLENVYVDEEFVFEQGTWLTGLVYDVKEPTRLKRDARFSFIPQYYTDMYGRQIYIQNQYSAKYTKCLDKRKLAKTAAMTAANQIIFSGFSCTVAAVKGAVQNEEGDRVKSSAAALYESTPLSYIEKGKDLQIGAGDVFMLNFKKKD
jgi:biopolymer transport protein ExbD